MARAQLAIRRGTARDLPIILALIRGLAEYERLAHQMEAIPARLKRHGFGPRPYFETLICRRGRTPVGFALYFYTYSTFLGRPSLYLEDLFVLPKERGKGAGKALLRALAKIAVARGCGRMEWMVLDWNTPSIRFYKGLGAKVRKEWVLSGQFPPSPFQGEGWGEGRLFCATPHPSPCPLPSGERDVISLTSVTRR